MRDASGDARDGPFLGISLGTVTLLADAPEHSDAVDERAVSPLEHVRERRRREMHPYWGGRA